MKSIRQAVVARIKALHRAKSASYGDAWKKRGEYIGIFANLARKIDRLENLAAQGEIRDGEAVTETVVDGFVYALKYLTYLAEHDARLAATLFPGYPSGHRFSDDPRCIEELLDQRKCQMLSQDRVRAPGDLLATIEASLQAGRPPVARSPFVGELALALRNHLWSLNRAELEAFLTSQERDRP